MARGMFASEMHRHGLDSECMSEVTENPLKQPPRGVRDLAWERYEAMVTQGSWYRCGRSADYFVHVHGGRFVAHLPNQRGVKCPTAVAS